MTTQIDAPTDVEQFVGTGAADVAAAFHAASMALGCNAGYLATETPFNRIFEARP
jgi:hypothetical protein